MNKPEYITGGILQAIRNDAMIIQTHTNISTTSTDNLDNLVNKIFNKKNIPKNPIIYRITKNGLVKMTKKDKKIYIRQKESLCHE